MSDEDGGVEESISSSARIALTVAIQLGEKLARAYQEAMREAQQRDAAQARELGVRLLAENGAARQAVNVVNDPQWWDRASLQDVARVAETAAAWKAMDPQMARADAVIAAEVGERYGIDVRTLTATVREARSDLDLAKEWAASSTPDYYRRGDDHRLEMLVEGGTGVASNRTAERVLIADYRAALADDIPTVQLALAEEWKRADDPVGFRDYRVETSIAFDESGRSFPPNPVVVDTARAELVQEWRTAANGPDTGVSEQTQSRRDLTEAQVMIAEADRLDRANDAAAAAPSRTGDEKGRATELEQQAAQYERDANSGGTPEHSPDELRVLAEDARSQAALYRDDSDAQRPADGVSLPAGEGRVSAARSEGEIAYDSSDRRAQMAATMRSQGVPEEQISARMTVDASFATPARGANPAARSRVPFTRGGRGQGPQIERSEPGR